MDAVIFDVPFTPDSRNWQALAAAGGTPGVDCGRVPTGLSSVTGEFFLARYIVI